MGEEYKVLLTRTVKVTWRSLPMRIERVVRCCPRRMTKEDKVASLLQYGRVKVFALHKTDAWWFTCPICQYENIARYRQLVVDEDWCTRCKTMFVLEPEEQSLVREANR